MNTKLISALLPLGVLFAPVPGPPPPEEVRCNYASRYFCDASGCKPLPIGEAFLLIPPFGELREALGRAETIEVRRCDDRGCTPVVTVGSMSGAFLNLAAPRAGFLLKLATSSDDVLGFKAGQFAEVATQMLGVYLGFGTCRFGPG